MIRPISRRIGSYLNRFGLAEALLLILVAVIVFVWAVLIPQSAVRGASYTGEVGKQGNSLVLSGGNPNEQSMPSGTRQNPEVMAAWRTDKLLGINHFQIPTTRLIGIVSELGTSQVISDVTVVVTDNFSNVHSTLTNASGWYTFTGTITNPLESGPASISASKTGYQPETIAATLAALVDNRQDIVLGTADMIITKKDGLTTVIPGQTLTYTIAITNVGSINASNIVITDVLPSSLSYVSDNSGVNPSIPTTGTYVWSLPSTLAPNNGTSFNLRVKVANALSSPTASIKNTAKVGTSSPEADLSNNTAEDTNTSTGTSNIGITLSVSPSQVRTAQNATYVIRVTNSGSALVTDVVIEDTFSSYLDLISTTPSKGTATTNNTTRKISVDISVLGVGETATVTVVGRVNNTATFNTTVTNLATVRYKFGGTTTTRTSNSASFQLIVTSVLPGTGGVELRTTDPDERPRFVIPILISGTILGVLGLFAIGYGIYSKQKLSEWSSWFIRMGAIFLTTAVAFGLALGVLVRMSAPGEEISPQLGNNANLSKLVYLPVPEEGPVWPSNSPAEESLTLPDYTVPNPTIDDTSIETEEPIDLTPVNRIIIPALDVDTVVKYVPYDGLTWLIRGLREEVAWMGDTSWPGLKGNTALAGHVSLYDGNDGPFRHLDKIVPTDKVIVHTDENIYTYLVREKRVVSEDDLTVLEPILDQQLTLITCTGWNPDISLYLERLVVIGELVEVSPFAQVISSR